MPRVTVRLGIDTLIANVPVSSITARAVLTELAQCIIASYYSRALYTPVHRWSKFVVLALAYIYNIIRDLGTTLLSDHIVGEIASGH